MSNLPRTKRAIDLTIVSPTRHESENVPLLIERVADHLEGSGLVWEMLFVDDSDDKTPEVIRDQADLGWPVRLIHRPPHARSGGLSGALVLAFRAAESEVVVTLDADLQHPPELLLDLVKPMLDGDADLACGSRYIPGGSAVGLDGPFRRMVSKASAAIPKMVFAKLRPLSDPGSGLFGFRRSIIDDIVLEPEGFKTLVEIAVRGSWTELHEVPYSFAGRLYGASKVDARLATKFLMHIVHLWRTTAAPRLLRSPTPVAASVSVMRYDYWDANERYETLISG